MRASTLASALESQISIYERHASKTRNLGEEQACGEMQVAINGPSLNNKKSVVVRSLNTYFSANKQTTG